MMLSASDTLVVRHERLIHGTILFRPVAGYSTRHIFISVHHYRLYSSRCKATHPRA